MDPQANLEEQLKLSSRIQEKAGSESDVDDLMQIEDLAVRLAELVQAMDEWRKSGGYDPYEP